MSSTCHTGTVERQAFAYKAGSRWQNRFCLLLPLCVQVRLLTVLWAVKRLSAYHIFVAYLYLYHIYIYIHTQHVCIYWSMSILVSIMISKANFVSYFIAVFLMLSKSKDRSICKSTSCMFQFLSYWKCTHCSFLIIKSLCYYLSCKFL